MRHPSIYVVTDLEGVGGIMNFEGWCVPSGYRNEEGCRNLTEEVNALSRGCFDAGFASVVIVDGHGSGGSIRMECLDRRVYLKRGSASGFKIEKGMYDAVAFVGQHAKAGAKKAHLAHTQTQEAVDFRLNGISIGEYGQIALCAAEAGIPVIFACGDKALTEEAALLTPDTAVVAVKEGLCDGPDSITVPPGKLFSLESAVLHYPRKATVERIYDTMKAVAVELLEGKKHFGIRYDLTGPFVAEAEYRAGESKGEYKGFLPARKIHTSPGCTIADTLNEFYGQWEWVPADGNHVCKITAGDGK